MTVTLTPTPVVLPATIVIPADGESVNSASVALYVQPMLNAQKYAEPVVDAFTTGAHQVLTGSSYIETPTGSDLRINGIDCAATVDGGGVSCIGAGGLTVTTGPLTAVQPALFTGGSTAHARMRAPKGIAQGSNAAGTHLFVLAFTDHVWNASAAAAGCIWQISTVAGVDVGETIRFVNRGTGTVQVNDQTGSSLINLIFSAGAIFGATFAWNGVSWDFIDLSMHP